MEIDIINYTDAQYARLNAEQILEVQSVQLKKNDLTVKLEENKRKEKYRLLKNGTFRSPVYESICAALDKEYENKVEALRDGLLFYLRFSVVADDSALSNAPYLVDYSLSYGDRLNIVRNYYDATYSNAKEKYQAFVKDTVAPGYIGEYYASLHDYYYLAAEDGA